MPQTFHCPQCQSALRRMSRNLDFFCRACFTSVVVLDDQWIEVMSIEDQTARIMSRDACRPRRCTEPLHAATTGVLELAS